MLKRETISKKIKSLRIKIPGRTQKTRPLYLLPFVEPEKTEVGEAMIGSYKVRYAKIKGKADILKQLRKPTLPKEEDIRFFEKMTRS